MFFVVNEHAGNGRGRRIFQRIRPLLGDDHEIGITQGVGDGRRIAAEAARAGHRLVVAVGGDGTVNETVNGLAEDGFEAALGIIPAGGGNDLAYSLGLPTDPERALAVLRRGHVRAMDLGLVTFDGGRRQRYYVNMLGVGLSGSIAALSRGTKRLGGPLTYGALLLAMMFRVRPLRFELSAEGAPVCGSALAAHLANGRREGRLFLVAPGARLDDGLLDMVAVEDVPLRSRPWYALQVLRGRMPHQPCTHYRKVRSAAIRAEEMLPCHVDGEPFLLEPGHEAGVQVVKGKLRAVAPPPD